MHWSSHISRVHQLVAWINNEVAALYPGCFALVMATGIISNALFFDGYREWADVLFAVNLVAYPCLVLLTVLRFGWFSPALWADLTNPRLVFSFFTIVAATDVFGIGINLRGFATIALFMWLFVLAVWFVLIYFSFAVLIFLSTARGANVVHGGWLIAIVGTESLVILGTIVAPGMGNLSSTVFVLIHMLWGVGLGLYGIFVTLFAYRIFFFDVEPDDITPLLWVVMGAAAIAANAGSTLILTESDMSFLRSMRPFIDGVTLIMWAWATWWIPLLLLFGIWKHGICRVPLTYTPMFWSLARVFIFFVTYTRAREARCVSRRRADFLRWVRDDGAKGWCGRHFSYGVEASNTPDQINRMMKRHLVYQPDMADERSIWGNDENVYFSSKSRRTTASLCNSSRAPNTSVIGLRRASFRISVSCKECWLSSSL